MSFTQYPRPGDVTDYPVPTQRLQRLVQFGAIWGGLWVLASLVFSVLDNLWGPNATDVGDQFIIIAIVILFYVIFIIAFAVIVFQWIRLAWQTVAGIRVLQTRLTPTAAAWLCVLPVINFVGLTYVMDFLVIRSRSKDERTMNALSVTSSEPLSTAFYYLLVLHFLVNISGLIPFLKPYINTDSWAFTIVDAGTQIACVALGYLLSVKVNSQLKSAAIPPRTFR